MKRKILSREDSLKSAAHVHKKVNELIEKEVKERGEPAAFVDFYKNSISHALLVESLAFLFESLGFDAAKESFERFEVSIMGFLNELQEENEKRKISPHSRKA